MNSVKIAVISSILLISSAFSHAEENWRSNFLGKWRRSLPESLWLQEQATSKPDQDNKDELVKTVLQKASETWSQMTPEEKEQAFQKARAFLDTLSLPWPRG